MVYKANWWALRQHFYMVTYKKKSTWTALKAWSTLTKMKYYCSNLLTIYGLLQSTRQYYKKATSILKDLGFTGGTVDPCLFYRETEKGKVYFGLYVDENLLIGDPSAIQETIQELKEKGLVLKVDDNLNDYLSCDIRFSDEKNRAWIGQPHLIVNLQEKFGDKQSEQIAELYHSRNSKS